MDKFSQMHRHEQIERFTEPALTDLNWCPDPTRRAAGATWSEVLMPPRKTVLTYGTFDLFHIGHLRLLQRLRSLGTRLVVGVSTDEFSALKGKKTVVPYEDRVAIVGSLKCVDATLPEDSWDQKVGDIAAHAVDIFGMGDDWSGQFDHLTNNCEVVYLPRTNDVSSTEFKQMLRVLDASHIGELKHVLDLISSIVKRFE